jgi:DNA-binding SARP family transcriptional activator
VATEAEFCLLGPLLVRCGQTAVRVPAGKQRILLAALLLNANRAVSLDELAEALWEGPAGPPPSARVTLQNYIKRLRHAVRDTGLDRITTQPDGYMIRLRPAESDVARFEVLVADGRKAAQQGSWALAADQQRAALGLWRGRPLADIHSSRLALRESSRLAELRLQALEARIDADLHLGRHGEVIIELRQLIAAEPLRERLHAFLMLALYRDGRQGDALAAYRHARLVLAEELGVEPGPALRDLHRRLLAADSELAVPAAAAPGATGQTTSQAHVPRQLPVAPPHFAGRTTELKRLSELLDHPAGPGLTAPVCAISGPAGVGKTALAVHWAYHLAGQFPDGQLYVNLRGYDPSGAPVTPGEALRGFLAALDVSPAEIPADLTTQTAMYRSILAGRRMLVVLDNALDASQARPLLPAGAGCCAVVTSRIRLTSLAVAEGAQLIPLEVLTDAEAAELLAGRLGAERLGTEPAAVNELSRLCACLPLALSIAAARIAVLPEVSVAVLADQLRDVRRRLDVLSTEDAATSVRAAFWWSYRSLSGSAGRMFRLLSLPPGPDVSVAAAASLAAVSLPAARTALGELSRSQLIVEHLPGRFACHDLLRAYAGERAAAEEPEAARAVATRQILRWYLHAACAAARTIDPHRRHVSLPAERPPGEQLTFDGYQQALAWLEAERANLTGAVELAARAGAHEIAWKLPIELWDLFNLGSYWADWIAADRTALVSARLLADRPAEGWLLNHLATAYVQSGELGMAISCFRQALGIRRALGDRLAEGGILGNLGKAYADAGRPEESVACLQQALEIFRAAAQPALQGRVLMTMSETQLHLGQTEQALSSAAQSADLCLQSGDRLTHAGALVYLAACCQRLGRTAEAVAYSGQAADAFRQMGDRGGEGEALVSLGHALQAAGDTAQSVQRWRAARAIFENLGDPRAAEASRLLRDAGAADLSDSCSLRSVSSAGPTGDRDPPASACGGGPADRHSFGCRGPRPADPAPAA